MRVVLKIKNKNKIKLELFSQKNALDSLKWKENNSLSRDLLANLDKIFQKNKITLDKISSFEIISNVPRKWTSRRIAEIVFKTLKIAR